MGIPIISVAPDPGKGEEVDVASGNRYKGLSSQNLMEVHSAMRRSPLTRLPALAAAAALAAAVLAPEARAQIMTQYSWMPPNKVQETMEKDRVIGIFVFEIPGEPASTSIRFNFSQPQVVEVLKKHKYAACKIAVSDSKSSRPWGTYQKLADEFGVSTTTTMVFCAWDRSVMSILSQVIKRDEFLVFLGRTAAQHRERVKINDEAADDLAQVEKWIESKAYSDAVGRIKQVADKDARGVITKKLSDKLKDLDAKLETAGKEKLEEGRRLLDAGKVEEAEPILRDVMNGFRRYECAKEAKDLLKKAGKG